MIRYGLTAAWMILLTLGAQAWAVPYTTMPQNPAAAPAPAKAPSGGTPLSDEKTKEFYSQCVSKPAPPMTAESQAALCACTAEKMQQTMTVEDQKVLAQNDQEGRNMLNRMLLNVYAPCMNIPVKDMLEKQCLQDMQAKPAPPGTNIADICRCMASKTGLWLSTNGRELMSQVLAANPNITDPMGPVMEDASFKSASTQNLTSCLSGSAP
jgi:hypothetical protein